MMQDLSHQTMYWRLMKPNFMPKTEEGALYFYVGAEGSDRTKILINNNVEGEPNTDWNWPPDIVLKFKTF